VLSKWSALSPPNESLLTQQGGCLLLDNTDVVFSHRDSGILKYTDVDKLSEAIAAGPAAAPAQLK
jgi:hypothetical protein